MAIITPSSNPVFTDQLRRLAQDDGGKPDIALDMVDRTNQVLLDNLVAMGGGLITVGTGLPDWAAEAGSVFIRTDGGNASQVIYVNFDGDAGSWAPLTA